MYWSFLAVAIGGAIGSLVRWFIGFRLNALFSDLPLGTLAANVIAGYIIGVAVAGFARVPQLAPEWRLFVITGFMGGFGYNSQLRLPGPDTRVNDIGSPNCVFAAKVTSVPAITSGGWASWVSRFTP